MVLPQEPPPEPLPQAAIALGSNLGNCRSTLEQALELLNHIALDPSQTPAD